MATAHNILISGVSIQNYENESSSLIQLYDQSEQIIQHFFGKTTIISNTDKNSSYINESYSELNSEQNLFELELHGDNSNKKVFVLTDINENIIEQISEINKSYPDSLVIVISSSQKVI